MSILLIESNKTSFYFFSISDQSMFENFCKHIAQAHKTSTSYPLSSFQLKKWDYTNDILDVRRRQTLEDLKITKVTILYFILLWVNCRANTRSLNLIKRSKHYYWSVNIGSKIPTSPILQKTNKILYIFCPSL